jgi:hypothetical protein
MILYPPDCVKLGVSLNEFTITIFKFQYSHKYLLLQAVTLILSKIKNLSYDKQVRLDGRYEPPNKPPLVEVG